MSVADLQRMTGASRGALDKLAHDKGASFDRALLERVCDALGIQPGELFEVRTGGDSACPESQDFVDSNSHKP